MLQVCLSRCCMCFTHMVQVFYLDVAYVCNGFKCFQMFLQMFQMHVSSISSVFRCTLQVLPLNVLKSPSVASSRCLLLRWHVIRHRRRGTSRALPNQRCRGGGSAAPATSELTPDPRPFFPNIGGEERRARAEQQATCGGSDVRAWRKKPKDGSLFTLFSPAEVRRP
jgi:hypothetical protein